MKYGLAHEFHFCNESIFFINLVRHFLQPTVRQLNLVLSLREFVVPGFLVAEGSALSCVIHRVVILVLRRHLKERVR